MGAGFSRHCSTKIKIRDAQKAVKRLPRKEPMSATKTSFIIQVKDEGDYGTFSYSQLDSVFDTIEVAEVSANRLPRKSTWRILKVGESTEVVARKAGAR